MTTQLWYSIKNRLESGDVNARNSLERFFTSLVTSYGCIDIWYRDISSDSNVIDCRIFYLQEDSTYTASALGRALNSWERTGEHPKFWLQVQGTAEEIRASIVSFLPNLSQLHDSKRHGEWNFGATQPFEGQGSIVTVDGSGNTVITGRFGDISLSRDGSSLNWDDITWSFSGCSPTATGPPADNVCFRHPGTLIDHCFPVGSNLGTCACGSCCGSWTSDYITQADCTTLGCSGSSSSWISQQDLTSYTSERWNNHFSCSACTGTCVTGNCAGGYSDAYPVTEAACTGHWFAGVDLTSNSSADWATYFNCGTGLELGCCILGSDCTDWDVSVTTSAGCTSRATSTGLPLHSYTAGKLAKNGCTLKDHRNDENCTNIPSTITVTIAYNMTLGAASSPGFVGDDFSEQFGVPFWWKDCDNLDGSGCIQTDLNIMDAITPGSAYSPPNFDNLAEQSGVPSCTGDSSYPDQCRSKQVLVGSSLFNFYYSNYSIPAYDKTDSGGVYTSTVVYVFDRDTTFNGDDETEQSYVYRGSTATVPGWTRVPKLLSVTKTCCSNIAGFGTKQAYTPVISFEDKIIDPFNSTMSRLVNKQTGEITYSGAVGQAGAGTNNERTSFSTNDQLVPFKSGFDYTFGSYHSGWYSTGMETPQEDQGILAMTLQAPAGPGAKVNTFGLTLQPTVVTFGGAYYQTVHTLETESITATVTVAES